MRRFVVPVLTALTIVGASFAGLGCKASFEAGSSTPKPPPPPKAAPAPKPAPPPAAKPKPKPRLKLTFKKKGEQLELPGPVVFQTNSDILLPESDAVLDIVYNYMKETPKVTLLRIEGHTDNDGSAVLNQPLSEKRAMAVSRWLTAKGIDCHRLLPVGFGQSKPIAGTSTAQTPDEKSQNRRVSFFDAAIEGKPIAGRPVDAGGKPAGDPCK
jgi:OOP family OmpA-OmpF porin